MKNRKNIYESRRNNIIQRATKIFVHQGYSKTNIREVADGCNVSVGTLYHYFASKEEILRMIIETTVSQQLEVLEDYCNKLRHLDAKSSLMKAIEQYYKSIDQMQDFTILLYQETKILDLHARQDIYDYEYRVIRIFKRLLENGVEDGVFHLSDCTIEAHNIVSLAHIWSLRRWFLRRNYTIDEYIKKQIESIIRRIGASK